jgi:hypothetical protein
MRHSIIQLRREQLERRAEQAARAAEDFRFMAFAICVIAAVILAAASGLTWADFELWSL